LEERRCHGFEVQDNGPVYITSIHTTRDRVAMENVVANMH